MRIAGLLPCVERLVPTRVAVKQGERAMTYAELCDRARRLAEAFRARGVMAGDRVALLGDPGIDLIVAEHAAVAIGAIPLAIYPTLAIPEMQDILRDAAPAVLVYDGVLAEIAARLTDARRALDVVCGAPDGRGESLADLIARSVPLRSWYAGRAEDVAFIVYTGGTSGRAKGVVHTHGSVASWGNMAHPRGPAYAPDQRSIVFNLAHLSGQASLWKTVAAGGTLVCLPRYPPIGDDILAAIEAERITSIGTVSGTFSDILQAPAIGRRDLRSLRLVGVGGAFTAPHLLQRAVSLLPPTTMVLNMYSLTESGQFVSTLPVNDAVKAGQLDRLRSVGRPTLGLFGQRPFSIAIVDDAGTAVPAGVAGEILVAGPQLMAGYWNNDALTRRTLVDGWLHTGDIGRFDERGDLYLVDRAREIIIGRNGVNVYPSEVAEVLARHPAIADVCVVGRQLEDAAEEIAAAVVLAGDIRPTLADLRAFCAGHLASFKLPSSLTVLPALPRTDAGKVDTAMLRRLI